MDTHERTVTIRNRLGLHARPAADFVKLAGAYQSDIWVVRGDLEVNGKSIMGVMMLAAEAGASISIRASGGDAVAALDALAGLVRVGLNEEMAEDVSPSIESI